MKDIDKELDEQIDEPNLDNLIHDALFHKTEAEKRQAIKALIADQVTKARIEKLEQFNADLQALDNYMEHDDSVVLYMKKKYSDQLATLNGRSTQ